MAALVGSKSAMPGHGNHVDQNGKFKCVA